MSWKGRPRQNGFYIPLWTVQMFKNDFKLEKALETFQKAICAILSAVKWRFLLVYFDDTVIFLRSPRDHVIHVRPVLLLLQDLGFTLKLKKYYFFTGTIEYPSHVIRKRRLEIATYKVDGIDELKSSTNITEPRSFLKLCDVFRRFVPHFAQIAAFLKDKLKKDHQKHFLVSSKLGSWVHCTNYKRNWCPQRYSHYPTRV